MNEISTQCFEELDFNELESIHGGLTWKEAVTIVVLAPVAVMLTPVVTNIVAYKAISNDLKNAYNNAYNEVMDNH